jgi:hypothetical protein
MNNSLIRPKEREAIIQSLRAGVVPRLGIQHIHVGRKKELDELIKDITRIQDGGSSIRFIIGDYGSGKTFFQHLVRSIAHEKGLVTCYADLTPDRRLQSSSGHTKNLFAELSKNFGTRLKPDGGAMSSIVEKFINKSILKARETNQSVESIVRKELEPICEMTNGFDFIQIILTYSHAHESGNDQLKIDSMRWLRGEFSTRTDANRSLRVRNIIDDNSAYDHLKLFARFVRIAGYGGLFVFLDELVNLYKLTNTVARTSNYEQILRILNDCLQGTSVGIGFLLCGTPEFLMDPRRGLYSYQALQTRLAENTLAIQHGIVDNSGPIIRLNNLQAEDLFVLLQNIRRLFENGQMEGQMIPDSGIKDFLSHCFNQIGDSYFRTPRTSIKAFTDLLAILEQNPGLNLHDLIPRTNIVVDREIETDQFYGEEPSTSIRNEIKDEFTSFKL